MKKPKLDKKLSNQVDTQAAAPTAAIPLFMAIEQYLDRGIHDGTFSPDRRLPSEMELARKFGVSRLTAVRAMQELKNRGLIERRPGSGTYIRKNPPTAGPRSLNIGMIVAGLGNTEILDPIATEISRLLQQRGHRLVHGNAPGASAEDFSPEQALLLAEQYIASKVDGVIFAPLELPEQRVELNCRIVTMLQQAGMAVILLDRDILDFPARSNFDMIGIDNFGAGFAIGAHLAQRKIHNACFLARPSYPGTTDLRAAGCREALIRSMGPDIAFPLVSGQPTDFIFIKNLLATHKPDAIVCANDRTAAMLMQTLVEMNIRVPYDMALAAFDDVKYATLLSPPLTTMRQPCNDLAASAVQMMLEHIEQPALPARMVLLAAELIARKSTEWTGRQCK